MNYFDIFKIKDYKQYLKIIFDGALPVFVAAIITNCIFVIIEAIIGTNDITAIIVLNFLYSLFFGHVLGFFIMIYLQDNREIDRYFCRLAIENASFAWNNTLTLIILKRIYQTNYYIIAFSSWISCIIIVLVIVYISNLIRIKYLSLSDEAQNRLVEFDSESFALSLTFSLTIIIASSIYSSASTNYIAGFDDLNPSNDDQITTKFGWIFLIYVIFISAAVSMDKYYEFSSKYLEKLLNNNYSYSILCQNILFSWDIKGNVQKAYLHLFDTMKAYMVASAWYAWLTLSFQRYFEFVERGQLLGLFIFAVFSTYLLTWLLSRIMQLETYNEISNENNDKGKIQTELLLLSGRLIVGWTWQLFLISCVGAVAPNNSLLYDWVKALIKIILAIIFFVLGAKYDIRNRHQRESVNSISNDIAIDKDSDISRKSSLNIDSTIPDNNTLKSPLLL